MMWTFNDVAPQFVARAATWFPSMTLSNHRNSTAGGMNDG
jgi:hypothetical protein